MSSAGSDPQARCSHLVRQAEGATNVLLLGPPFGSAADEACADLLTCGEPGRTDLLAVTLVGSPDRCLDVWQSRSPAQLPAKVGFVTAGNPVHSAAAVVDEARAADTCAGDAPADGAAVGTATASASECDVTIARVSEPADLTGIGIRMSQFLGDWHGDGNRIVVCFDSLTTLLQSVERRRAFQFLHVLTKRIETVGGVAHVHMDPAAHDARTVATMRSLFDAVLAHGDDGWEHG